MFNAWKFADSVAVASEYAYTTAARLFFILFIGLIARDTVSVRYAFYFLSGCGLPRDRDPQNRTAKFKKHVFFTLFITRL
jgi:hypothetical protein